MSIHPTAVVAETAVVSPQAEIGPFCVIGGQVEIGAHTVVESHARIGGRSGRVTIGEHNLIQNGAVIGGPPQDLSYGGDDTQVVIGHHNRIGEFVTVNIGTPKGGGVTRIGDHNMLMAYTHLGHDCRLENHTIIANCAQFGGHALIEEGAFISGNTSVTPFVRLGRNCLLGASSAANKDILPFTIAEGLFARPRACNRIGLKRAGVDVDEIREIERAVKIFLDSSLTIAQVTEAIKQRCSASPLIEHLLAFLASSKRGLARH